MINIHRKQHEMTLSLSLCSGSFFDCYSMKAPKARKKHFKKRHCNWANKENKYIPQCKYLTLLSPQMVFKRSKERREKKTLTHFIVRSLCYNYFKPITIDTTHIINLFKFSISNKTNHIFPQLFTLFIFIRFETKKICLILKLLDYTQYFFLSIVVVAVILMREYER